MEILRELGNISLGIKKQHPLIDSHFRWTQKTENDGDEDPEKRQLLNQSP